MNKANKSSGPRKFLQRVCKDVFKVELTHRCQGHAIDATAEVHRNPGSENLSEEGGVDFVQAHSRRFRNEYLVRDADGKLETDLVVWCYDHAENVEPIQECTQSGRTKNVVASEVIFDANSQNPLPAGTGSRPYYEPGKTVTAPREVFVTTSWKIRAKRPVDNRHRLFSAELVRKYLRRPPSEVLWGNLFTMAIPPRGRLSRRKREGGRGRKHFYKGEVVWSRTRG